MKTVTLIKKIINGGFIGFLNTIKELVMLILTLLVVGYVSKFILGKNNSIEKWDENFISQNLGMEVHFEDGEKD